MTVTVNGVFHEFTQEMNVADLLRALDVGQDGIAVALNGTVVPRKNHPHTMVRDGDSLEIIRAVAGG